MDQKALLRTLTINQGQILVPYIESYLGAGKFPPVWKLEIPNFKEPDPYFHPSSDCFTPPIDLFRQKKGTAPKKPITAALRKTFICGHMWHSFLETILQEMGFVQPDKVEVERTVTLMRQATEFTCRGTIDLLDVEIPERGAWLVDIKTMNKGEFEAGANKLTFKKWLAQVSCYMDWMDRDQAMILAVCKDSPHQMREYIIEKDKEMLEGIYNRWVYTQMCLTDDTLPNDVYQPDPLLLNPGDSVLDAVIADENRDS